MFAYLFPFFSAVCLVSQRPEETKFGKTDREGDSCSVPKPTQSCGKYCSSVTAQTVFFLPA